MNNSSSHPLSKTIRVLLIALFVFSLSLGAGQGAKAAANRAPVDLGTAGTYVILTKTGVTNVPTSQITGNIGVSPISSTAITGFSLKLDSSNKFSTSTQVNGKIYAANYAAPTPSNLTTAISNMQTAYTDAAGRSLPDYTELYSGNLSGRTLAPGLYKWSTGVLITSNVTLSGPANAVWIFQIAGNLTIGSGAKVMLSGGAQAGNIFWQVGGGVGVEIGTTAHVEGIILAAKAIHLRTGASMNGRALSQTAVTLEKNIIVIPKKISYSSSYTSNAIQDGWVLESGQNTNIGGSINNSYSAFAAGDDAKNRQFRAILSFDTSNLPDDAVITSVVLKIMKTEVVGTNPFTTLGSLVADIRKPYFGTGPALSVEKFQASSNAQAVATFGSTPVSNWYSSDLNATGRSYINHTGTTQFRLRFTLDDNNNNVADYMKFASGNASSGRPTLIVEYYYP